MSQGLLAAADRREGATLYRYYEPAPTGAHRQLAVAPRGRLARRYRLAPPGAAELRQRLGLHPVMVHGAVAASGERPPEEEEPEPGFAVAAADSRCRPAVGALALAPAAGGPGSGSVGAATAAAAAVLDASGQLSILQQRWPLHEPALHQRCGFSLREAAVALLPASLAFQGDTATPSAAAGQAAVGPAATGMVAVTAGGSVLALQPLPQEDARQLLALHRALAAHPAAAPLSGGSHAAFRGPDSGERRVPVVFRHPPPAGADPAAAVDLLSATSPGAAAGQAPFLTAAISAATAEPAGPQPGSGAAAAPGAAAPASGSSPQPPGRTVQLAAELAVDTILDGELLKQYLLLAPPAQRQLVAALGGPGGSGDAAEVRAMACQLTNLVARLLL